MRAVVIDGTGGPDVLRLAEVARPSRVNAECLVRVVAAGVNPIDAKSRAGGGAAAAFAEFPVILGNDFSGVVVETSHEASPIQPGDDVYGMTMVPRFGGTYAEYIAVPAMFLAKKPRSLTHVEAAAVPLAALTAWGLVVDVAKVHDRQRILIHAGAGGVGHFAIQFARFFGAVVVTTGSARNADWLRSLGAAQVIDYTSTRFEHEVHGLDVVIDLVGNSHDETGVRSLGVLRPGGLLITVPSAALWPTMVADAASLGVRATGYRVPADGGTLSVISRLLESGEVRVFVDHVFDLAEVSQAHAAIESGHTRGKLVLRVAGE